MLLPAPSLTSNTGRETGLGLETGFFGMEGGAGSFKEPLPGAGPFRSTLAFSLSTEAGVRTSTETNRSIQKGPERTTQPKKPVTKERLRLWEAKTMSMERSGPLQDKQRVSSVQKYTDYLAEGVCLMVVKISFHFLFLKPHWRKEKSTNK